MSALLLTAGLAAACGDNGSSDQNASPTAPPGSPSPATALTDDQVITLTQEYPAQYKVDNPDGTFRLEQSTINSRVDDLCADDAKWSARQTGDSLWRVGAECKKEEAGTPVPFGFELLRYEWLYYPELRQVMPVSQAAHDAQYPFPQPSTVPGAIITVTPLPTAAP